MSCRYATWLKTRGNAVGFAALITLSVALGQEPGSAPERCAGIEIGAKGVKATVVEVGSSRSRPVMEAISNTTIAQGAAKSGKFSDAAIRDTAEEAGKFARRIRDEFKVPADRVCVVGSSGLPKVSNRDDLVKAVADTTNLPKMTFLVPADEVRLTIKGLLDDESERDSALLVDVGSGNTKGGFLGTGGVVDFSVPLGSVTFANRVTTDASAKKLPFADAAAELRPELLEKELSRQVDSHPELAKRPTVFLAGGASYALATLMKPEAVTQKRVELTAKDIAAYAKLVRTSPITRPSLDAITDPATRAAAEKEVKNVLDTFTPQNLIAGAEVLTALASTFNLEDKKLLFDRTAITAWIRAKALEQAPQPIPVSKNVPAPPQKKAERQVLPSPQSPSPE
jgi:hypothetical protein